MVTLEAILERNNLNRAYKQVKANKGGPGVDGITVDALRDYLRVHAVEIVETVKAGKYKPQPVRRVMIPKEEYWPNSWVLSTTLINAKLRSWDGRTGGHLQIGCSLRLLITAHCGSARWVVWKGVKTKSPHPYPIVGPRRS